MSARVPCLSDDLLVRFAKGMLDEDDRMRVAEHLDSCEECLEVLADAEINTMSDELRPSAAVGVVPSGTMLGRYWIHERIGAGARGEVYAAYDPKLDRRVALKRFRQASGATQQVDTMVSEARALAKLAHPNVVSVFDVQTEDDTLCIAMELVHGDTLDQWCAAGSRTWREVQDVFVQAGAGLAAAHDAGLVHRDFKPSNVLVTAEGRVRVVDFGLATGTQPHDRGISGTPAYMAPEQWRDGDVTGKADQFSFCVSLFEAVYGNHPFRDGDGERIADAVLSERPVVAGPAKLSGTPGWVAAVLARGLVAEPSKRHADMNALLHALQRDRRTRRFGALALTSAVMLSAGTAFVFARATVPAQAGPNQNLPTQAVPALDIATVEALHAEARQAAANARYVYPSASAPDRRTAYRVVLELEALEAATEGGPVYSPALRAELAAQLQQLGDEYWERPGGRGFAIDFYSAALLFDDRAIQASERAVMTPGQLTALRDRASDSSFTLAELEAAQPLAALGLPDDDARVAALAALFKHGPSPGYATTTQIEQLLGPRTRDVLGPSSVSPVQVSLTEIEDPPPQSEAVVESPKAARPNAAVEIAAAKEASTRGALADAKRHYHRALAAAPRSHAALHGLARIHYHSGEYSKAFEFAQRGTAAAPRNAELHLLHGDAGFKLFRYGAATRAYERARELGSSLAAARLKKVERKIGTQP